MDTMSVTVEQGTLDRLSELARCLSLLEEITPSAVDLRQFVGGLKQGTPLSICVFLSQTGQVTSGSALSPAILNSNL
jgi:hypothetical protein